MAKVKDKAAIRWQFLVDGNAIISPSFSDEGEIEFMLVETPFSATKCYSAEEVDNAIDIALHISGMGQTIHIH